MFKNVPSIVEACPVLGKESVVSMLERARKFHPNLDAEGVERYVCDLFCLKKVDELITRNVRFENIHPSLSSEELHALADRVAPYHDNDKHRAIFAVRHIIDSVPKSLDDLIDYTTQENLNEFYLDAQLLTFKEEAFYSLEDVRKAFLSTEKEAVYVFGNYRMDASRKNYKYSSPAPTVQQDMLFAAADYYLNHRVGFRTNTIWLACFLSSGAFGCPSGWLHRNGDWCGNRHYGFKDDEGALALVLQAEEYLITHLSRNPRDEDELSLFHRYVDTILDSQEYVIKQMLSDLENDESKYRHSLQRLRGILSCSETPTTEEQDLRSCFITRVARLKGGMDDRLIALMSGVVEKERGESPPPKPVLKFFDAWNFLAFEQHLDEEKHLGKLPWLFLQTGFVPGCIEKISAFFITVLSAGAVDDPWKDIFMGFFSNYMYALVNENSSSFLMYDEIFEVSLNAACVVDTSHVIALMAALGYPKAIEYEKSKGVQV